MNYFDELFTNFPTENARIVFFVLFDLFFDLGGRDPGFGTPDHAGTDGTRFLIPIEDFGYTAMADAKLSRNHTGTDSSCSHFDDF